VTQEDTKDTEAREEDLVSFLRVLFVNSRVEVLV
jgi:hypothetical protein